MRLLLTGLWFVTGAGGVFAAGTTPTNSSTAGESSIDAAKRELDTIKATRNPAAQPGADLPRIAAPELQLNSPAASPWPKRDRASKAQLEAEKKAKNWLVEGVEKEKRLDRAVRDGRVERIELESERVLAARDGLRGEEVDAETPAGSSLMLADDAAQSSSRKQTDRQRDRHERETAVMNPLSGFMAGWMTPQDLALLQPNLAGGEASASSGVEVAGGGGVAMAPGTAASLSNSNLAAGLVEGSNPTGTAVPPRENPYLATLGPSGRLDALVSPPPAAVVAPPPAAASVFPPVPMAEPPSAKSKIPEFAKPPTDDKYFKQLKRF